MVGVQPLGAFVSPGWSPAFRRFCELRVNRLKPRLQRLV